MISMLNTIAFLALLAAPAQDDVYKSLAVGDRVEVTFRNGNTLTGSLSAPPSAQPAAPKRRPSGSGGPPFFLYAFLEAEGGDTASQMAALEAWRKRHPQAAVRRVAPGQQQELWDRLGVKTMPTLVFEAPAGKPLAFHGFHGEDKLDEALGKFRAGSENEAVDFSKEPAITIDLGLEYPGLDGTMSIPKTEIRNLRKLQNLDEATLKRLIEEKKRVKEEMAKEEASRRAEEQGRVSRAEAEAEAARKTQEEKEASSGTIDSLIKKQERLDKGKLLLKKFPPPEWGEHKIAEIAKKGVNKLPVTPAEREFSENIKLWAEALQYEQEQKGKEKPPGTGNSNN